MARGFVAEEFDTFPRQNADLPKDRLRIWANTANAALRQRSFEIKPPNSVDVAMIAALLRDASLWSELIRYLWARDKHFYDQQRSYGVSGEDLGDRQDVESTGRTLRQLLRE